MMATKKKEESLTMQRMKKEISERNRKVMSEGKKKRLKDAKVAK
jgi:hypothetical protein